MTGYRIQGPFCEVADNYRTDIDKGTLCRARSPTPGIVGLKAHKVTYSYAVSGKTGALGSVLFTETDRLPGTWYDHTDATTAIRKNEAKLGMSKYADKEFRKSAKETLQNIKTPQGVDVDIHFETRNGVENITVRGRRGTRSFQFDFNGLEARMKKLPQGTDVMKLFKETITEIFAAVIQLR